MTAPGCGGADEIRDQLAAALAHTAWCPVFVVIDADCKCLASRRIHADRLLPTVQALIAKGAAAELRAAAEGMDYVEVALGGSDYVANVLRDRADALDGTP